jgi:formylmethanofuran dehydrogenase subunit D
MKKLYLILTIALASVGIASAQCDYVLNMQWHDAIEMDGQDAYLKVESGDVYFRSDYWNWSGPDYLPVKAADYQTLKVRIQNNTDYAAFRIYVWMEPHGNLLTKDVTFSTRDTEVKEYVIDISDASNGDYASMNEVLSDTEFGSTAIHWIGIEVMDGQTIGPFENGEAVAFVFEGASLVPGETAQAPAIAHLNAKMGGEITWDDVCATSYNLVLSAEDVEDPSTLNVISLNAPELNIKEEAEANQAFSLPADASTVYVYVQSVNAAGTSAWAKTSFFFYTGETCTFTVQGTDLYYELDPDYSAAPWGWYPDLYPTHVDFIQDGITVGTVGGSAAFDGTTIPLISGIPVTIEWVAEGYGYYDDPCSLVIVDGSGAEIVNTKDLLDDVSVTIGTFDVTCGQSIREVAVEGCVAPTLSNGFITVKSKAGAAMQIIDLTGKVCKTGAIRSNSETVQLDLANGVYFVVLTDSASRSVAKVVLKK